MKTGYTYRVKYSGAHLVRCLVVSVILLLFAVFMTALALIMFSKSAELSRYVLVFDFLLIPTVLFILLPYFFLSYEVDIIDGMLAVYKVRGAGRRRTVARTMLYKVTRVSVLLPETKEDFFADTADINIDALSSKSAENVCAVFYVDSSGRSTRLLFEPSDSFFSAVKYYNPVALLR